MKNHELVIYESFHSIESEEKFYKQLLLICIDNHKQHFIKTIRTCKRFKQFLYKKYPQLKNHKLAELYYWFYTNLTDFPKCEHKHCNNKITTFYKFFNAYNRFCSPKCSNNSETTKQTRYNTCIKYYGKINPNQYDSKHLEYRKYRSINVYKLFLLEESIPMFSLDEFLSKNVTNNNNQVLTWKCTKCNTIFRAKPKFCKNKINGVVHHARCPKCYPLYNFSNNTISIREKEVVLYIKSIYSGTIIENDRTLMIPNKKFNNWKLNHELDIVLPDLKLAFEFNGTYWHNADKFPETITDDNEKIRQCNELGFNLVFINEYDWINNRTHIQYIINKLINN